ncbi:nucleotide exchange factor GrpE [Actinoplanes bogorensis]|uniref:Nucleotide exchange factor GrpE n=1 Tax=Paractinoplanes bogorensis TaxID=1610840 RepID=A0ABS5YY31_9ACTN|nr:nucleotide exchange factor GrpE [Actinoplanes bogorensis]MBU2668236.1 nucleotide exchange factor GrpE [Actinoplanes bogorensis]
MTLHETPGAAAAPEEPAVAESLPEAAPDLEGRLTELGAAVGALRQELRAADERSAGRDRMIERLHDDNQKLRAGERRMVLMPLLTDLQRLRNDLIRQAASVPAGVTADQVAGLLDSFAQSVELTLERGGVGAIRPVPGDRFDGTRHRPAAVLPASRPDEDGCIADVLSDGYLDTTSGRVLTPATVRVHRWTEPATAPQQEENHV